RRARLVQRHRHCACGPHGPVEQRPLVARAGHDPHGVAGLDAARHEALRDCDDLRLEVPRRDLDPGAVLGLLALHERTVRVARDARGEQVVEVVVRVHLDGEGYRDLVHADSIGRRGGWSHRLHSTAGLSAPRTSIVFGVRPPGRATCRTRTGMYAIGVDIGGRKIAAGVVDEDGRILAKTRRDTATQDSSSVDTGVLDACRELLADFEVGAIGLVASGFVSSDQRTVMFTPNLPWRDHPLRDNVAAALGLDVPIVVENDANGAAWAEFRFGAGRDVEDMM